VTSHSLQIPKLKTARLRLEPLSMTHSQGMFEMWRHDAVQEFSGPAKDEQGNTIQLPAQTHRDSNRLINFWLKASKDGWGFRWALLMQESSEFVGHLGFNSLHDCSEVAYHMSPVFWGKGLMTEAAKAAIEWRRSNGATEIEAFIEPENSDSISLALRLGMRATNKFSEGAQRYCMSF
jgi:ribosomal-protein-alanine N-acetyltransferase